MIVMVVFASICALAAAGYLFIVFSNHALKQKLTTPMHWLLGINTCFVVGVVLYVVLLRESGMGYIFVEFLLILGVIWILALYPFFIWIAADWAKRTGRSAKRWGFGAAIGLYLLVFWDHIPTLVLHKYYCATKAGFWVYKTPEQWKAENPGVAETLTWKNLSESFNNHNGTFGIKLNERFVDETRQVYSYILPVKVSIDSVVDIGTNEIMTKRIRVGSGYGSFALGGRDWRAIKFWVHAEPCLPGQRKFSELSEQFKTIGREIK